jgi:hypothetical protein
MARMETPSARTSIAREDKCRGVDETRGKEVQRGRSPPGATLDRTPRKSAAPAQALPTAPVETSAAENGKFRRVTAPGGVLLLASAMDVLSSTGGIYG